MQKPEQESTHFGYQKVSTDEKATRVGAVFDSVASQYDLMNDFMSFGMHRWWKRQTIIMAAIKSHHQVLDVAGGTGDMSERIAPKLQAPGHIILSDINASMLQQGRNRLLDSGQLKNLSYVQADAEHMPFADNSFDRIIMAFGLRNVTRKDQALVDLLRMLKPGGQVLILEFSKPVLPLLATLYDKYSFNIVPKLGEWIVKDRASYQYLVESIRMHPDQATLKDMMQAVGFEDCCYHNFTGGIVALHRGYKY